MCSPAGYAMRWPEQDFCVTPSDPVSVNPVSVDPLSVDPVSVDPADTSGTARDGEAIVVWSWRATGTLAVALVAGVVAPSSLGLVAAAVSLVLFAVGIVVFLLAYAIAVRRSRTDDVSVAGLYLLSEGAPTRIRRHLLGSLATQTTLALVAASVRPFTPLAFGLLVPTLGLGLAGLWSARHGTFRPRPPAPPRRRQGKLATATQPTPARDATINENTEDSPDAR